MLTKRIQMQALVNRLNGFDGGEINASLFSEPFLTCWNAISNLEGEKRFKALSDVLKDKPDLITELISMQPGPIAQSFKTFEETSKDLKPIEWLWPGWIPRGMLTLLGGVQGSGKSLLVLELARRLIHESRWSDNSPIPKPHSKIIYLDGENTPNVINEHCDWWDINKKNMTVLEPVFNDPFDFGKEKHQEQIVELVFSVEPELIIVDSLSSISTKGENNVEDVRVILSFLNTIARDSNAGLILLHHLRKPDRKDKDNLYKDVTLDDFRGSGHITAMARSVIGLSVIQTNEVPDPNGPRKLNMVKTNLAQYSRPMGFELLPLPEKPGAAYIQWGDVSKAYSPPTKQDECAYWLECLLKDNGPMRPKEIAEIAKEEELGYSLRLIHRAHTQLGEKIQDTKGKQNPDNQWMLRQSN